MSPGSAAIQSNFFDDSKIITILKPAQSDSKIEKIKKNQKRKIEYNVKQHLSVNPHFSAIWNQYRAVDSGDDYYLKSKPPHKHTVQGKLSDKSRRKITKAINWMMLFSPLKHVYSKKENTHTKFKLNFITLTLSATQVHSDDYIKKHLLEPFLKWMIRSHQAKHYIWKAEAQDNGNIHFHITTNVFIHWLSIRKKWNKLLDNHKYKAYYQDGSHNSDPNSIDVHAVKNEKELALYLGKYFGKQDERCKNQEACYIQKDHFYQDKIYRFAECSDGKIMNYKRQIEGKLYAYSRSLADIKCTISESDQEFHEAKSDFIQYNSTQIFDKVTNELKFPKKLDFAEIHINKITAGTVMHRLIGNKIQELCKVFQNKSPGKLYYEIESLHPD